MKKSLLVFAAAIPLVVIGSVAVWQLSGSDTRRPGAITATDQPVTLFWRGAWSAKATYTPGQAVSHRGGSYVAEKENANSEPDPACARDCTWGILAVSGISGTSCTRNTGGAGTLEISVASTNVVTLTCNAPPGTDADTDADKDGIPDGTDADDDGDGIADGTDSDANGDGELDNPTDWDKDGVPNPMDTDDDGDGVYDAPDTDDDNDGIPDGTDADDDGDGMVDGTDTDANGDGELDNPTDWDKDGIPNATDTDDDGDGVSDAPDTDDDNDGVPDATDPDHAP